MVTSKNFLKNKSFSKEFKTETRSYQIKVKTKMLQEKNLPILIKTR
jgi:hypothetical protein